MARGLAGSGWFASPNAIFESGLGPYEIVVLAFLHRSAGPDGSSWPSIDTIAASCGVSNRTVQRACLNLETVGWIHIEKRESDHGASRANLYRLEKAPVSREGVSQSPGGCPTVTGEGVSQSPPLLVRTEGQPRKKDDPLEGTRARPTLEQYEAYFVERGSTPEKARRCFDYYQGNGWVQGKSRAPIKDWQAVARGWIARDAELSPTRQLATDKDRMRGGIFR